MKNRALEIIDLLRQARLDYGELTLNLAEAERGLTVAKAQAESDAIIAAGDEKALGANQAARDRALVLALQDDPGYAAALQYHREAMETRLTVQAEIKAYEDELKVILAFAREAN